jgi:hypothetical protein
VVVGVGQAKQVRGETLKPRASGEPGKEYATPGLNVFTPVVPWVGIRGVISPP